MSAPAPGEAIYFHRWETSEYVQYDAIVRVSEDEVIPEVNLSWFNSEGIETPANNVKNVEDAALGSTEDYWRHRYGDVVKELLSEIKGHLETVRVEKGDMVLFRPWDSETHWTGGILGVCVTTLGQPTDPHPVINLKYVNASGTTITASNVDCIESAGGEDAAEGSDLWSNVPEIDSLLEE